MTDDILRRLQELNERHTEAYTHQWALTWVTEARGGPYWEIVDVSDLPVADSAQGATPEEAYRELLNWFYGESADD